jgi:hypothetical protein
MDGIGVMFIVLEIYMLKNNETTLPKKIVYATAFLLMAEIVTVTIPVAILGSEFNFPDILR